MHGNINPRPVIILKLIYKLVTKQTSTFQSVTQQTLQLETKIWEHNSLAFWIIAAMIFSLQFRSQLCCLKRFRARPFTFLLLKRLSHFSKTKTSASPDGDVHCLQLANYKCHLLIRLYEAELCYLGFSWSFSCHCFFCHCLVLHRLNYQSLPWLTRNFLHWPEKYIFRKV